MNKRKIRIVLFLSLILVLVLSSCVTIFAAEKIDITWEKDVDQLVGDISKTCFGNDIFVAVGFNGYIVTSTDGIKWAARKSMTSNALYGITYAKGQFVAVGQFGTILTSTDGVQWTAQKSPTKKEWLWGVTYGKGRYVAVGYDGKIITSTDGITWTSSDSGVKTNLNAVICNGDQFVAVGYDGVILTSQDGINWTQRLTVVDTALRNIAWNGKVFVTAGDLGRMLISSDGVTWSPMTPEQGGISDICWNGSMFIAVGQGTNPILLSKDGSNWQSIKFDGFRFFGSVGYNDNRIVISETTTKSKTFLTGNIVDGSKINEEVMNDTNKAVVFSSELMKKLDSSVILYVGESKAFVKGEERQIDTSNPEVSPVIINDKTLVPVRFVSESFGANVEINDNEITITLNNKKAILGIGSNKIIVDGDESMMTVESQVINDRTFIPLRSLSEALGKRLFWDDRGLIIISDNEKVLNPKEDSYQIDSIVSKFVHKGNSFGNNVNYGHVAQQGEWIYYSNDKEKLMKMKLDGSMKTDLSVNSAESINVLGGWIYCRMYKYDTKYNNLGLYKIKTDGSEMIKLSDDNAISLNIIGDTIYYINQSDYSKPYKMNLDGNNRQRLNDYPMKCLNVVGNRAYFQNDIDAKLYSMTLDGTDVQKIVDDSSYNLNLNASDSWLFYEKEGQQYGLYKINMDTSGRQMLDGAQISYLNVANDWIYYGIFKKGIYRIKIDGSGKQKLNDDYQSGIYIIGDWIYYEKRDLNSFKSLGLYKMKFDGSNNQKL